jgi:branched-chain amino acid transport system permease protein
MVAALAGFGYASFSGVVAPELAGFVFGTEVIIWVALGGRGTVIGPVLGAIAIDWSSAYLSGNLPYVWKLFLGIAFVLVIVLLPQGLLPSVFKGFRRFLPAGVSSRALKLIEADPKPVDLDAQSLVVELKNVSKNFGSLKVLADINFSARAGELVSLIGPNGAGKTTLMRGMSDGEERASGLVCIQGHEIKRIAPHQCVQLGLGRKFQTATVFDTLTVGECLRIARTRIDPPSFWRRRAELSLPPYVLEVLSATELDQKLDIVTSSLSHGEKQALELAMVLALEPRVVLLDEPTAGLSMPERSLIGKILVDLTSRFGLCLLLVEHDLDFVREISTRIVVLHQGRLVLEGTVAEVVDSELIKTIYSGSVGHA